MVESRKQSRDRSKTRAESRRQKALIDMCQPVKSIKDLWLLAKICDDSIDDNILADMVYAGLSPRRVSDIGYEVIYKNLSVIYFPKRGDKGYMRLACPKIYNTDSVDPTVILEATNSANAMVNGVKFVNMEGEIWAISEYRQQDGPDDIVQRLDNLLAGVRVFHQLADELHISRQTPDRRPGGGAS